MDSQLNSLLADILNRAADKINDPVECPSTECLLHHIDADNRDPDRPPGQTTFSLDVKAMYPSMEKHKTAEICSNMVIESGIQFISLDWEEATLYLVLTNTPEDLSQLNLPPEVLPTRKHKAGPPPRHYYGGSPWPSC